jgi:hypothetical protein
MPVTAPIRRKSPMQALEYSRAISEIMEQFACRTGLSSSGHLSQRYLWTDAFAVCNFLGLYRHTGRDKYRQFALDLVDQVHETLGKHRKDDPRTGWISGLKEAEGRQHPAIGGLRIGKELGERKREQAYDERLEWDRDGQYYHYLTKWMHALHQISELTEDPVYNLWACELARTAHRAFVHRLSSGAAKRMYWKMSIDLTYPLIPSMGHHDPLDGFVTYHELNRLLARQSGTAAPFDLADEIADLTDMCRQTDWTTDDPLGIGGLLFDACRILQMKTDQDGLDDHGLLPALLDSSCGGLKIFLARKSLKSQVDARLAFRELGLAIGLRAVAKMHALLDNKTNLEAHDTVQRSLERLMANISVGEAIETFWLDPAKKQSASWQAHENINMVMLATSLEPDGFLTL